MFSFFFSPSSHLRSSQWSPLSHTERCETWILDFWLTLGMLSPTFSFRSRLGSVHFPSSTLFQWKGSTQLPTWVRRQHTLAFSHLQRVKDHVRRLAFHDLICIYIKQTEADLIFAHSYENKWWWCIWQSKVEAWGSNHVCMVSHVLNSSTPTVQKSQEGDRAGFWLEAWLLEK